jgi:hypothetical protein
MSRLAHPWRGLSICCAETRLGVGPDIGTRVDACAQRVECVRHQASSRTRCLFGSPVR